MGKQLTILVLLCLMLTACAAEETFETVADELAVPVMAQQRQIYVELPDIAASPAVESGSSRLYLCGDYDISIQILEAGDLAGTIRSVSGFEQEELTVISREQDGYPCYEFVFASAGETGDQTGRGMILDDGSWHYCLTVLGNAQTASQHQAFWETMFRSFRLV